MTQTEYVLQEFDGIVERSVLTVTTQEPFSAVEITIQDRDLSQESTILLTPKQVNHLRLHLLAVSPAHEHVWVDASNEAVLSGEICLECMSVREGN